MEVIAHRGANQEAAENSNESFVKAIEGGAHRIEVDVQTTVDGVPFIFHDPNMRRMTGLSLKTSTIHSNELAKLKLSNGEQIPILKNTLDRFIPKIKFTIELKDPSIRATTSVLRLLADHRSQWDRILVSSFHPQPLGYLADREPTLNLACLWGHDIKWPYLAYGSPNIFMQRCHTKNLHPSIKRVDHSLMEKAKAYQWKIVPFASMEEEESDRELLWAWLKTLGVDGFCTNYPRQLSEWLREEENYERTYTQA